MAERERDRMCLSMAERERQDVSVYGRERERDRMSLSMAERERQDVSVYSRVKP